MAVTVRAWMSSEALGIPLGDSALAAFDLMLEHGFRHLPVLDEGRRVVGILSLDDLRAAFPIDVGLRRPPALQERARLADVSVADAMTWAPHTVRAETSLEEAARTLAEHRIGCLPVVDASGRLVGLLSETDALRALVRILGGEPAPHREAVTEAEGLVASLEAERRRLLGQLGRWQEAERALSIDRGSEPRDEGDVASDEHDISRLEPLSARAARRLRAIEEALERAEKGRIGRCERCHGHIPWARLRVVPETTLCVRCAREESGERTVTSRAT